MAAQDKSRLHKPAELISRVIAFLYPHLYCNYALAPCIFGRYPHYSSLLSSFLLQFFRQPKLVNNTFSLLVINVLVKHSYSSLFWARKQKKRPCQNTKNRISAKAFPKKRGTTLLYCTVTNAVSLADSFSVR
jgi:hypothetical protein